MSGENEPITSEKSTRSPLIPLSRDPSAQSVRSTRSNQTHSPSLHLKSPTHESLPPYESSIPAATTMTATNLFSTLLNFGNSTQQFSNDNFQLRQNESAHSQSDISSVNEDNNENSSIHLGVEQIITRPRKQSYENIALSLATSAPQQFYGYEGKAKITVKIIYPNYGTNNRLSETKTMSLRALLLDILNEAQRYEDEANRMQQEIRNHNKPSSIHLNVSSENFKAHDTPAILERSLHHSQLQLDHQDRSGFRRHGAVLVPTAEIMVDDTVPLSNIAQPTSAGNNQRGFILPLRQRDLRRLEANTYSSNMFNNDINSKNFTTVLPEQDPYILIRKHVVLFSFGELVSAVVQAERLILIVHHQAYGAEAALDQLERHISEWIRTPHSLQTSAAAENTDATGNNTPSSSSNDTTPKTEVITQHPFAHNLDNASLHSHSPHQYAKTIDEPKSRPIPDNNIYSSDLDASATNSNMQLNTQSPSSNTLQLPFSLRIYDALFATMFLVLQKEVDLTSDDTDTLSQAIGTHSLLSLPVQEALRLLKGRVSLLRQRVLGYVRLLSAMTLDNNNNIQGHPGHGDYHSYSNGTSDVTETNDIHYIHNNINTNEAYYAFLNLAALRQQPLLYSQPLAHTLNILDNLSPDLDFMLEGHLSDFQGLLQRIRVVDQRLGDVEDMVSLRLDISRNELLVASTVLSVFACTIGFAGFVTGAFGMNLDNSEEFAPIEGMFGGVFGGCLFMIVVGTLGILQYFRVRGILPTHTSFRWSKVSQIIRSPQA